jgi:hypothetical protein
MPRESHRRPSRLLCGLWLSGTLAACAAGTARMPPPAKAKRAQSAATRAPSRIEASCAMARPAEPTCDLMPEGDCEGGGDCRRVPSHPCRIESDSGKVEQLIVGRWANGATVVEFNADGTGALADGKRQQRGRWTVDAKGIVKASFAKDAVYWLADEGLVFEDSDVVGWLGRCSAP